MLTSLCILGEPVAGSGLPEAGLAAGLRAARIMHEM